MGKGVNKNVLDGGEVRYLSLLPGVKVDKDGSIKATVNPNENHGGFVLHCDRDGTIDYLKGNIDEIRALLRGKSLGFVNADSNIGA